MSSDTKHRIHRSSLCNVVITRNVSGQLHTERVNGRPLKVEDANRWKKRLLSLKFPDILKVQVESALNCPTFLDDATRDAWLMEVFGNMEERRKDRLRRAELAERERFLAEQSERRRTWRPKFDTTEEVERIVSNVVGTDIFSAEGLVHDGHLRCAVCALATV